MVRSRGADAGWPCPGGSGSRVACAGGGGGRPRARPCLRRRGRVLSHRRPVGSCLGAPGARAAAVGPHDWGARPRWASVARMRSPRRSAVRRRAGGAGRPNSDGPGAAPRGQHERRLPGPVGVLAPVTERGESIGLLEFYLPEKPDREVVAEIGQSAPSGVRRDRQSPAHGSVRVGAAQPGLQPVRRDPAAAAAQARTCEAAAFTLAGWLELAASIGGDTFDYSLARDLLHLSLTDAMGHGVGAALTASVCLGSPARSAGAACRWSSRRRRRTTLCANTLSAAVTTTS